MFRVLHTADLHLGRAFVSWGAPVAEMHQVDLLRTLERIGQISIEQSVQLVLIAGDLFDVHNPAPDIVGVAQAWLRTLAAQGMPVAIIPGNHDSYWYQHSVYRHATFPDNTYVFTEPICTQPWCLRLAGSDVTIYGIAHDHTRERQPLRSYRRRDTPGIHIGMLHATIHGSPNPDIDERYLPLTSDELTATGLDYLALGHIHSHHVYNAGIPGRASYPGSPEPLAIDEFGPRSVNLISFDDGPPHIKRIHVGVRQACRLDIECTGLDQAAIVEQIKRTADRSVIVEVRLSGMPNEIVNAEAIRDAVAANFFHVTLRDETEVVDAAFARAIEHEKTIRGSFVRTLRARAEAATPDERATIELALKRGLIALHRRSVR